MNSVITLTTTQVPRGNTHCLFKNLKFNVFFELDAYGFQIKLWCWYLGIVGPFFQKLGKVLFNFLDTLALAGVAGQENDLSMAKIEPEKRILQS